MNGQESLIRDLEFAIESRPARSAESLRYVTDLFVSQAAHYTEEQIALFDDVIARLAAQIEVGARAQLARRLAPIPNAPRRVIHSLAFDDETEVACPVLTHSECLNEDALVENARSKSQAHLLAISKRKTVGEAVTDVLVTRGDKTVVLSAVENNGAKFSDGGYATLVLRSQGDDQIAAGVGSRPEIPRHHFLKLLTVASQAVRIKLEQGNPQAAEEIRRVVREVANRTRVQSISDSYEYSKARNTVAERCVDEQIKLSDLNEFAVAGQFEETVVALSILANVPVAMVERALVQERIELLLSILKTVDLGWPEVKPILQLRVNPAPLDLEQCLANYERLKMTTARLVVDYHCKPSKAATS
jgi:uncharacterized protein (DUF2336 family)